MPATSRPAPRPRRPAAPPAFKVPPIAPEEFARHDAVLAILLNSFHLAHLVRLYAAFDGDLLQAIVLGEVAHHNVAGLRTGAPNLAALSALFRDLDAERPLLPTNAFSIALATGIPRQTVRRKVDALVRRQLLRRDGRANLFVAPQARHYFSRFTMQAVGDLLATARDMLQLTTSDPPPPARPARARPSRLPR
jgi:hypothetical protein